MATSTLNQLRIEFAKFLSTPIIPGIINLWSIVHFFAGALIMFLLIVTGIWAKLDKFGWVFFIGLLILWEVFEIVVGKPLFLGETPLDIIFDIIIGTIGGYIVFKLLL